ncbi:hypothetical protein [Mesorhizobium sp. GbtcB19]|uniref:hypothetical protein n=1 Tax=Mesorhizobium sp. GbtcB19 TaxID=2824764 RepID=UPI001C2FBCBF|nr:hypothetical protein [Mesorhizobium sp. GbtcB19]
MARKDGRLTKPSKQQGSSGFEIKGLYRSKEKRDRSGQLVARERKILGIKKVERFDGVDATGEPQLTEKIQTNPLRKRIRNYNKDGSAIEVYQSKIDNFSAVADIDPSGKMHLREMRDGSRLVTVSAPINGKRTKIVTDKNYLKVEDIDAKGKKTLRRLEKGNRFETADDGDGNKTLRPLDKGSRLRQKAVVVYEDGSRVVTRRWLGGAITKDYSTPAVGFARQGAGGGHVKRLGETSAKRPPVPPRDLPAGPVPGPAPWNDKLLPVPPGLQQSAVYPHNVDPTALAQHFGRQDLRTQASSRPTSVGRVSTISADSLDQRASAPMSIDGERASSRNLALAHPEGRSPTESLSAGAAFVATFDADRRSHLEETLSKLEGSDDGRSALNPPAVNLVRTTRPDLSKTSRWSADTESSVEGSRDQDGRLDRDELSSVTKAPAGALLAQAPAATSAAARPEGGRLRTSINSTRPAIAARTAEPGQVSSLPNADPVISDKSSTLRQKPSLQSLIEAWKDERDQLAQHKKQQEPDRTAGVQAAEVSSPAVARREVQRPRSIVMSLSSGSASRTPSGITVFSELGGILDNGNSVGASRTTLGAPVANNAAPSSESFASDRRQPLQSFLDAVGSGNGALQQRDPNNQKEQSRPLYRNRLQQSLDRVREARVNGSTAQAGSGEITIGYEAAPATSASSRAYDPRSRSREGGGREI